MNDQELKEFLDWLTDETTYNIPKDEINEIVQDWNYFKANSSDENNKTLVVSSTNSEVGSSHWFRTIVAQHKDIGEFLMTKTPTDELLRIWGEQLYKTSAEIIKGHKLIK